LLSRPMGPRALDVDEEQGISAGISLAATHNAESERLCRPSPAVSHLSDPLLGAKIASAAFGGLAVLSCYWLLFRHRIRYPLVWLIALLACSAPFLFRMNMAKAPPFAIVYLVIAIYLFFRRKYWPLLPLALIFTWTYDLFV